MNETSIAITGSRIEEVTLEMQAHHQKVWGGPTFGHMPPDPPMVVLIGKDYTLKVDAWVLDTEVAAVLRNPPDIRFGKKATAVLTDVRPTIGVQPGAGGGKQRLWRFTFVIVGPLEMDAPELHKLFPGTNVNQQAMKALEGM